MERSRSERTVSCHYPLISPQTATTSSPFRCFRCATGPGNQWLGIRRTDVDVTPRGSQFIDYDVPCDDLMTNGAMLQYRPPCWIRQPMAVRATEPTILMGGRGAGVARTFGRQTDKPKMWGSSSISSRNIFLQLNESQN
jgi:hypothetical protein